MKSASLSIVSEPSSAERRSTDARAAIPTSEDTPTASRQGTLYDLPRTARWPWVLHDKQAARSHLSHPSFPVGPNGQRTISRRLLLDRSRTLFTGRRAADGVLKRDLSQQPGSSGPSGPVSRVPAGPSRRSSHSGRWNRTGFGWSGRAWVDGTLALPLIPEVPQRPSAAAKFVASARSRVTCAELSFLPLCALTRAR